MNIELYNQKRDELSILLQDVVSNLEQIDNKYKELDLSKLRNSTADIAAIRKRVYEDIFKIVLVAKFQGGKSTSFNAMTGGLCYSPMGNGSLKCSASPVSAKNVINQEDEGVTVTMRSHDELCRLLEACGYPDVDLNSEQETKQAREAWEAKFELFKQKVISLDSDELDLFFVAGIIFAYYDTPVVQEYLNKKTFDIEFSEISSFAKFPEDRTVRISRDGVTGFDVKEIIYAFVQKVEIRVKSAEMAKIGACFVDAPGIGVNTYDTSVAKNELTNASAVWYLLGAKQPGADELKTIRECLDLCKGRIFFSANIIGSLVSRPQWIDNVLPQINQHINNAVGESVEIRPYHALLALLYIQGEYFIANGKWGDDSVKDFLAKNCEKMGVPDLNRLSAEECWKTSTMVAIRGLYPFGLPEFDALQNPLSPEGLAIIRRESNWDGTVEAIREFVIKTKSKSILITDTSQMALERINYLKKLLETREADAQKTFDELNAEYSKTASKIEELKGDIQSYIDEPFLEYGEGIDANLAEDFYTTVLSRDTVEAIAKEAAPLIAKKSGAFRVIGAAVSQGFRKASAWFCDTLDINHNIDTDNAVSAAIGEILSKQIRAHIDHQSRCWGQTLLDGNNCIFNKRLAAPLKKACNRIMRELNNDELLLKLAPQAAPHYRGFANINFTSAAIDASFSELLKDLIATIIGGLIVLLIPFLALTMGIILALIKVLNGVDRIQDIEDKLKTELSNNFENKKYDIINGLKPQFAQMREKCVRHSKQLFDDIFADFEKRKNAAFDDFRKGKAHRDQVAKKCKEIRERYIEGAQGLEQKLVNYIVETEPLCNAENNE